MTVCDAPRDRSAQARRHCRRPAAACAECFIALRQPGFGRCSLASATATARRGILDAPRGTARSVSSRSARACSARAASDVARASATSATSVARSSPRSVAVPGGQELARADGRADADRESAVNRRRRGRNDRLATEMGSIAAGTRSDDRSSTSRTCSVANGLVHCCSLR
jgi:hypothetical protein